MESTEAIRGNIKQTNLAVVGRWCCGGYVMVVVMRWLCGGYVVLCYVVVWVMVDDILYLVVRTI